jgi:hypothetical protein
MTASAVRFEDFQPVEGIQHAGAGHQHAVVLQDGGRCGRGDEIRDAAVVLILDAVGHAPNIAEKNVAFGNRPASNAESVTLKAVALTG